MCKLGRCFLLAVVVVYVCRWSQDPIVLHSSDHYHIVLMEVITTIDTVVRDDERMFTFCLFTKRFWLIDSWIVKG